MSYAFSKSILNIRDLIFLLELLRWCTTSWAMIALSQVPLPGANYVIQEWPQSLNQNLGDEFETYIA